MQGISGLWDKGRRSERAHWGTARRAEPTRAGSRTTQDRLTLERGLVDVRRQEGRRRMIVRRGGRVGGLIVRDCG